MTQPQPNLPKPFLDAPVQARSRLSGRFTMRPALVVFLLCLVLGMIVVGWRAKRRAEDARSRARAEALAAATALESQFGQASSAAEVLGALARQLGGAIPNFPKIAAELLAGRPGVASLELQPGGVVSDIVPRAGNERVVGFNVLSHPAYGPGAKAAIQKGGLTVAGPLALYRGEPGIVARVPVLLRGRDGRDAFWGFVAVSMRLSDALGRARVDDLAKQGYNYALLAPASGTQKPATIAGRGTVSLQDAVQQPVRAHDLEFRFAVQPRAGWANKTRLLLEALGVVAGAGLVCLVVNLLESRRSMEVSLAEVNQRLSRETADRKQSQDECRAAKNESAAVRAELDQARSALQSGPEQEVRLNVGVLAAQEAAQARQGELDQARMALQQGEQTIRSLQARLHDAGNAEKKSAAALQAQLESAQATIADLQARLEAEARRAREAAEAAQLRPRRWRAPHRNPPHHWRQEKLWSRALRPQRRALRSRQQHRAGCATPSFT